MIQVLGYRFKRFSYSATDGTIRKLSANEVMSTASEWKDGSWAASSSESTSYRVCVCLNDHGRGFISFGIDKEDDSDEIDTKSDSTLYTIVVRDAEGLSYKESSLSTKHITCNMKDFIELSQVLDTNNKVLGGPDNSSLQVDLIIQPKQEIEYNFSSSSLVSNMLKLFDDIKMIDIAFRFPSKYIFAHTFVLQVMAPDLFGTLGNHEFDEDKMKVIPMEDDNPDVFYHVVRYLYGGGLPSKEFILEHGMSLIDMANKFGITDLKLEIEAMLVSLQVINLSHVIEYFSFSDAKDCALLHEYAISMLMARKDDVFSSDFESICTPKLVRQIMLAKHDSGDSVAVLREKLLMKNLCIDGSKKTLISRLESSEESVVDDSAAAANESDEDEDEEIDVIVE